MTENLNLKTVETVDTRPFRKLVMTIGELPTSFIESMTYYELLAWFTNYLETVIIPTVNNNGEAVEELQQKYIELKADTEQEIADFEDATNTEINRFETELNAAFTTLKNYVDNYFDNLDVQEEINNKLDDMAEQGILQEIITTYIQSNVAWTFDTVADMKLATNLVDGSFAQTLGFYSINDGGGAIYKITSTGTANEMDIIAIGSTLLANIVKSDSMNVKQFGAKGDNTNNDTNNIQRALSVCSSSNITLRFPSGSYVTNSLTSNAITIKATNATLKTQSNAATVLLTLNGVSNIDGITFDGNSLSNTLLHNNVFKITLTNCIFKNSLDDALDNTPVENDDSEAYFENVEFINCVGGIRYTGYPYEDRNNYKGSIKFINCKTKGNTGTTENNRLYMFTKLRYVSVQGGEFTGDSTHGATNIYQVNHGEVIGGYYHDIQRGVTLGLITEYCIVTNTINENITGAGGLHIDLVTEDRVHPAGHSIISNNIVRNGYRGLFVQGKNLLITNNYIYCGNNTATTGGVIRFNDDNANTSDSNIIVDNLYVYNLGSIGAAITCGKAVVTLGSIYLDGTAINQTSVVSDNPIFKEHIKTANATGSTPVTINDDIILINASSSINIMLPNANETKTIGKKYTLIRTDDTVGIGVNLRCRSDNGYINGVVSAAGSVPISKGVTSVIQTGAGEYWTLS